MASSAVISGRTRAKRGLISPPAWSSAYAKRTVTSFRVESSSSASKPSRSSSGAACTTSAATSQGWQLQQQLDLIWRTKIPEEIFRFRPGKGFEGFETSLERQRRPYLLQLATRERLPGFIHRVAHHLVLNI